MWTRIYTNYLWMRIYICNLRCGKYRWTDWLQPDYNDSTPPHNPKLSSDLLLELEHGMHEKSNFHLKKKSNTLTYADALNHLDK